MICAQPQDRRADLEVRTILRRQIVIKASDVFILLAVMISFFVSGFLWFNGFREQGVFTAIWVPSILCFGIYFKLMTRAGRSS